MRAAWFSPFLLSGSGYKHRLVNYLLLSWRQPLSPASLIKPRLIVSLAGEEGPLCLWIIPRRSRGTGGGGRAAAVVVVVGARWDSDTHIDRLLCGKHCFLGGLFFAADVFTSVCLEFLSQCWWEFANNRLNLGKKSGINQTADGTTGHILVTDVSILQGFDLLFPAFFLPSVSILCVFFPSFL